LKLKFGDKVEHLIDTLPGSASLAPVKVSLNRNDARASEIVIATNRERFGAHTPKAVLDLFFAVTVG